MRPLVGWLGFVGAAVLVCSGLGLLFIVLAGQALREDIKGPLTLRSLIEIRWQTWLKLLGLITALFFFCSELSMRCQRIKLS
jgi:Trk-type K+ transport system membrane component